MQTTENREAEMQAMSLRDWLAGQVIQTIKPPEDYMGAEETAKSYREWASKAYRMADALLVAREGARASE